MKRPSFCIVLCTLGLLGCPQAHCPEAQLAAGGACYPEEAVRSLDGGVPTFCEPSCEGETPLCDYHEGRCVECTSDAHCSSPDAPRCDPSSGRCSGCLDDASCEGIAGRPSCLVATGECVECTAETEAEVCGDHSCRADTHRCSTTPRGTVAGCLPCHATSECRPNLACVEYQWQSDTPRSFVCLPEGQGGCATSANHLLAPYGDKRTLPSIDGEARVACTPFTTCEAARSYVEQRPCTTVMDCSPSSDSTCHQGRCRSYCPAPEEGYDGCLGADTCNVIWCGPP